LHLSAIPDLKVRAIGSDLEAVFVLLPCPLGRGFGRQTAFFQGFSLYIFCFSEKSLKGLKPSQIIFYTLSSIPDLKVRAIGRNQLQTIFFDSFYFSPQNYIFLAIFFFKNFCFIEL